MSAVVVAAGAAVAGAAATVYAGQQQKKAQEEANAANLAANGATNAQNYAQWLESRGVGQNGQPVNTQLPRYFGLSTGTDANGRSVITGPATLNSSTSSTPLVAGSRANPLVIGSTAAPTTAPNYSGWTGQN